MNIINALTVNGKATLVLDSKEEVKYAMWRGEDNIWWVDEETGKWNREVGHSDLLEGVWEPYDSIPEIKPKTGGELWSHKEYGIYFSTRSERTIIAFFDGMGYPLKDRKVDGVIHGKNGWERIYPTVEKIKGTVLDSMVENPHTINKDEVMAALDHYFETVTLSEFNKDLKEAGLNVLACQDYHEDDLSQLFLDNFDAYSQFDSDEDEIGTCPSMTSDKFIETVIKYLKEGENDEQ